MTLIEPGIKKLIENNAVAFTTISPDGSPHSIAVAYCKVFGDQVIITNSHMEESVGNLKADDRVAMAVWNKEWEEACVGFELRGTAESQTEGKWFEFVKEMPDNEGYDVRSAIVVKVTNVKKLLS
ncbi:pyridoxamine 5'-phosphate oxidase family protein [Candidatus Falkowbacteria bacterium]|nr:pyridoxamine 5'-phosphate oxidase family protein [Candidatus Falkowbacteria bacterium]